MHSCLFLKAEGSGQLFMSLTKALEKGQWLLLPRKLRPLGRMSQVLIML